MYLIARKFSNVKQKDVVIKRVREELVPTMKDFPGFIAYYGTHFDDGGLGAVSLFDSKENAEKGTEKALGWVKKELGDHLPDEPLELKGEILFAAAGKSIAASA